MAFRTYRIGRKRDANIHLVHASVSRRHAELTLTTDGRYYLTDRGSLHGTWVSREGNWTEHRQGYVKLDDNLRFGEHEVRLGNLLEGQSFSVSKKQPAHEPVSVQPRRNIGTGEVEV